MRATSLWIIVAAAIATTHPAGAGAPVDWARPETIDPRAQGVLDFLDTDLGAHERLAEKAHREGRYEEAARLYLFVLRHRNDESRVLFNLACAYARMGDGKRAVAALRHAVDAGFSDFETLRTDEDLKAIHGEYFFTEFLSEMSRREALLGGKILVPARSLVPARINLPRGHDPKKPTTLLIGLHGYGATCEDLAPIWGYLEDPRFIFVAPESPYRRPPTLDAARPGFTWGFPTRDKAVWAVADPMIGENMAAVAAQVSRDHRVGDAYLLGHSQGGSYATLAAIEHPESFRGVIVLAGTFPEESVSAAALRAAAGKVRFFLAYGRRDQAVPVSQGQALRDRLAKAGFDVTWVEHDGDHRIAPEVLRQAVDWMRKTSAPPTGR